jgi:hypothetical protein
VGDGAWSATHTGIESGFSGDGINVAYPIPTAPAGANSWSALTAATGTAAKVSGTNYTYVLSGNATVYSDFRMNSGEGMIVTGDAILYVSGKLTQNAGAFIYIDSGASLKLYVGGSTTTFNGNGVINGDGSSSSFSYYGLAGNTTIKYAGNFNFVGTLNAPNADFTLTGGASFFGAAIVNTYTSKSSGSAFHYDESVGSIGKLVMNSYREI